MVLEQRLFVGDGRSQGFAKVLLDAELCMTACLRRFSSGLCKSAADALPQLGSKCLGGTCGSCHVHNGTTSRGPDYTLEKHLHT